MEPSTVVFLPLDDDTRQCAAATQKQWNKSYRWLVGVDLEQQDPLGIECINIKAAEAALTKIDELRELLEGLRLYVPKRKFKPMFSIESGKDAFLNPEDVRPVIFLPYDEFFHGEFTALLERFLFG